jgi:hypothetical protein
VYSIKTKQIKQIILRYLIVNALLLLYQAMALVIKTGAIALGYNYQPQYVMAIMYIDLIILSLAIYLKGGINSGRMGLLVVFPEAVNNASLDSEDLAAIERYKALRGWRKVRASLSLIGFQFLQWGLVLLACAIGSVFLSGLVISAAFIIYGFVIQRRWHSNSLVWCTLSAVAMFFVAASVTPSFKYTEFLPILVALALIYGLYRIAIYAEKYHSTVSKLNEYLNKTFTCATASAEELRERCLAIGKSDEDIEFAIDVFRSGKPYKTIADERCVTPQAVKKRKARFRAELETPL